MKVEGEKARAGDGRYYVHVHVHTCMHAQERERERERERESSFKVKRQGARNHSHITRSTQSKSLTVQVLHFFHQIHESNVRTLNHQMQKIKKCIFTCKHDKSSTLTKHKMSFHGRREIMFKNKTETKV